MRIWDTAMEMAEKTPAERNRYVDFLRAVSIMVVVIGHWLIATAWYVDGQLIPGHLLKTEPDKQWMTWIFQVMPIFFIVGGYANGVSLESAARKGIGYSQWLAARINRLISPLLVLLIAWAGIALVMHLMNVPQAAIKFTSQSALIPTWFLAIYTMIVILAPLAYKLWLKLGIASILLFIALAAITDVLFFAEVRWPSWANYFWIWLAVHQLGFAWRDGKQGGPMILLIISAVGFGCLYYLIHHGPYPVAMVGSPDEDISNSLPPKVTLIALGFFQFGLLLAIEGPMRRMLSGLKIWAATVLINSMIMSLYLWHITVMVILGSLMYFADGWGFRLEPGTIEWWQTRPLWILVLLILLFPVGLLMSPLERVAARKDFPPAWRQIVGATLMCTGIALLAMWGFAGAPIKGLDVGAFVAVVVGAGLSGLLPSFKK